MIRFETNDLVTFEMSVRDWHVPTAMYVTRPTEVRARVSSIDYSTYPQTAMVQTMDGVKHMVYPGRLKKVIPPPYPSTTRK